MVLGTSIAMINLSQDILSMTSFKRMPRYYPKAFAALCDSAGLMRAWGDCYGYLMVATGRAEAMLDPAMSIWDAAALHPIIKEAGGRITTWAGEDRLGDSVVATNGLLHEAVLAALAEDSR